MLIKNSNTITGSSYDNGSGLNMMEWFCLTVLPLVHGVIIYFLISSITEFVWWVNLIIAFSIWAVLVALIIALSWWMAENDILRY